MAVTASGTPTPMAPIKSRLRICPSLDSISAHYRHPLEHLAGSEIFGIIWKKGVSDVRPMTESRRRIRIGIVGLATAALFPFPATLRAIQGPPPVWQRITFPPLAIPGTNHDMVVVRVSQEVLVGTAKGEAYEPAGTG